jgi:valyl-tRNA synthetase
MSKSLGNVVDPLEVIEQFGTDALRFTMATGELLATEISLLCWLNMPERDVEGPSRRATEMLTHVWVP